MKKSDLKYRGVDWLIHQLDEAVVLLKRATHHIPYFSGDNLAIRRFLQSIEEDTGGDDGTIGQRKIGNTKETN